MTNFPFGKYSIFDYEFGADIYGLTLFEWYYINDDFLWALRSMVLNDELPSVDI